MTFQGAKMQLVTKGLACLATTQSKSKPRPVTIAPTVPATIAVVSAPSAPIISAETLLDNDTQEIPSDADMLVVRSFASLNFFSLSFFFVTLAQWTDISLTKATLRANIFVWP